MPVYTLLCLFTKLIPIYVAAFFLGPTITGRMACGFLLLMESVPKDYQAWAGAALMVGEGSCMILWTVYFVWINKNAYYFVYGSIVLSFICCFGMLYVEESPRYLFGMEKFEECKKVLTTIASKNGKKDYVEPTFSEENILLIENADDVIERINPSGPVSPESS